MIKIARTPKPKILIWKQKTWTDALLHSTTQREKRNASAKYRHDQIKEALNEMFHGKCAYCESQIAHTTYTQIEHYRPKSEFPQLTYEWSNLLLACPVCNGPGNKGDRFPGEDEGDPLVNPCEDDPGLHLEFHYDQNAKLATVVGRSRRGQTTMDILGLNRPDLRNYRSEQVSKLLVISHCAKTDKIASDLLDQACEDSGEFAAFARQIRAQMGTNST